MVQRHAGSRDPRQASQHRLPWYAAPVDVVLDQLVASERGLPEEEAFRRLELIGPNRISAADLHPAWEILGRQLRSVVVLLLLAALTIAWFTGRPLVAAVIALVIVCNIAIGFATRLGSRRFVDRLLNSRRLEAVVLRVGRQTRVDASNLVPGDVIEVVAGQRVPADARLIAAAGLMVEQEVLSGDASPVDKAADTPLQPGTPLRDRTTMLFSGSTVTKGRARAVVTATGAATAAARLGRLGEALERRLAPLEARVERLLRRTTWVTLSLATVAVAGGFMRGYGLERMLETGIALAVAAVPQALLAVTTVVLAITIRRMARRGVLVRHSEAVETLGSATVLCSDVVGHLTSGPPQATRIITPSARATVVGAEAGESTRLDVVPATTEARNEIERLLRAAALTRDGGPGDAEADDDPGTTALWNLVRIGGMDPKDLLRAAPVVAVVPYDPVHRMSASFHHEETGRSAFVRGAPDAVLERCGSIIGPSGTRPLDTQSRARIEAEFRSLAAEGYRVVAYGMHPTATRTEDLRVPFVYLGMVGLEEASAPGIAETYSDLENAGIRTVLLTEEEGVTGQAVARKAGVTIRDDEVLNVAGIPGLGAFSLARAAATTRLFGRLGTDGRRRVVEALRDRGEVVVAVETGGEMNFGSADATVAPGAGSEDPDAAGADVVLGADGLPAIAHAIQEVRRGFDDVRRSVTYILGCSLAVLLAIGLATLLGWPLPLLPLQVLWLNLVTVPLFSLALAAESGTSDAVTRRPPKARNEILTRSDVVRFSGSALLMALATLAAFLIALELGSVRPAVTVAFTTLALAQFFHLATARLPEQWLQPERTGPKPWAFGAIAAGLVLQLSALYWAPLSEALGTVAPGLMELALAIAFAAIPALVGQVASRARITLPLLDDLRPHLPAAGTSRDQQEAASQALVLFDGVSVPRTKLAMAPASKGTDDPWDRARAAVEAGDLSLLRELVRKYPKLVRARDDEGTLLHHATGMPTLAWPPRAPDMVSFLVESGADPDAGERMDGSGETPLIHAVSVNNVPVARRLLELGADPERHGRYPDQGIDTALGYALFYGQDPWFGLDRGDCVELLLNWGARASLPLVAALGRRTSVDEKLYGASTEDRLRALIFAAHRGEAAVVRTCLDAGVNPSGLTGFFHERLTPLLAAAGQGHLDAVQVLLEAGAETEWPDDGMGATAMMWAWTRSAPGGRLPPEG